MPDNQGNLFTSMEDVIRSPSSNRSLNIYSDSHGFSRKSFDSYMSALGPGLLDAPFGFEELQRSGPLELYNRRRSYVMDTTGQDMDKVQIMNRYNRQIDTSKANKLEGNKFRGTRPHLPPKSGSHGNPSRRQQGMMMSPQDQDMHARAVAAASAAAAQAAAVAAHAAAEVMRLTYVRKADHAATVIQAAYRGHLARQALRALKGLVKLQAVIRGHLVRRQARIALRCMQALVRLQARARARQVKALLDDQEKSGNIGKVQLVKAQEAFQQQQMKLQEMTNQHRRIMQEARSPVQRLRWTTASKVQHADSSSCTGSFSSHDESQDWDNRPLSKEEIEYRVRKRQEAMAMRQKALSYAEQNQARRGRQLRGTARAGDDHDYGDERQLVKAAQLTPERHGEGAVSGRSGRLQEAEFQDSGQMMRDWSWLEGWMAAQYGVSSTLWESQDADDYDDNDTDCLYDDCNLDKYLYDNEEEEEEEDDDDMDEILDLQHRLASLDKSRIDDRGVVADDHPSVKIIEMDRVATPSSYHHRHVYQL